MTEPSIKDCLEGCDFCDSGFCRCHQQLSQQLAETQRELYSNQNDVLRLQRELQKAGQAGSGGEALQRDVQVARVAWWKRRIVTS